MFTFKCKICGKIIEHKKENVMRAQANKHLKEEHNMSVEDYLIKYELNGVHPKCLCGCGEDVHISHGWTWNKYAKDSHVGKRMSIETAILNKKIAESKVVKFNLEAYYSSKYDRSLAENSAKDFLSKEYTLSDLEDKYKIDKRTLHKLWLALGLMTAEQYNEVITYTKYTLSTQKRSDSKRLESDSVFVKLYFLLKSHPQKYTIYSLIKEYNKNATEKIVRHPDQIYKILHKMYGDEIDIYFSKGYHSQEEYQFYEVLSFYHPEWKIKLGYSIEGYNYIYDICIENYLIIEYQSKGFYHSTETQKENDDKKRELAVEKGFLFKQLSFNDIKNINTIKQIEKWLSLKK